MKRLHLRNWLWSGLVALCLALPGVNGADGSKKPQRQTLFNRHNFEGWRAPTGEWVAAGKAPLDSADARLFQIQPGEGILVNGAKGKTVDLKTEAEYGDVLAHVEFVVPKGSNSGVYFMGRYEVQVYDSYGVAQPKYSDCGGIYASCSEPKPDWPGCPPNLNASRQPGEWQTLEVLFRAPRFDAQGRKTEDARFVKVLLNGKVIHENVKVPRPTCSAAWLDEQPKGPLMLQGDHGPVAYRNLWVQPTMLE